MCFTAILINYLKIDLNFKKSNYTFKQFIQYQTDATRKAAEIIEKSKVRRSDTTSKKNTCRSYHQWFQDRLS